MKALSLFTGIMGIDLACEWAGIETVAMCEWNPFCQEVIRKHKPNIPLYSDIKDLSRARMEQDGIDCGAIDLIHGGEPCQPYSLAGEREGETDDRYLWPEVKRLLQEIRPRWYVRENVAGNISLGIDQVLSDLEDINYTAEPIDIPACGVGADHRRERIFIIAHTNSKYVERGIQETLQGKPALQGEFYPGSIEEWSGRSRLYQPKLLRTFNGIPRQVDRIRALGNTVVPKQIYPILAAIKQINDMKEGLE
jgi:DNA (cytosine-5)-methyltransferase 1